MSKQTIAVDFDGVIHAYSKGWSDGSVYDIPVAGSFEAIRKLMRKGYEVVVMSARAENPEKCAEIHQWFLNNGMEQSEIEKIQITNLKVGAIAYIDDRGIRFTNWQDVLNYF